jgi:hypothetical protein
MPEDCDDAKLSGTELEIWSNVFELARSHFTVDVTVHLGLKPEQERQLFHDLNNLGKKPDAALSQAFDQANPVSVFIRREIEARNLLGDVRISDIGSKKGQKRSSEGAPTIFRDDLVSANAMLFAGATNQAGIMPSTVVPHTDYAVRFWKAVASQPHFGEEGWEEKTLLAEPVMIKALAQLAYTFHDSREKNHDLRDSFLADLEAGKLDFSPTDPLWALHRKTDAELEAEDPRLLDYITPEAGRKSYATWQGDQLMSFAQNTRDIARYLGDAMRWKLGLPARPGIATLKAKLVREGKMQANTPEQKVSSAA